jgi:hypothetical protein
VRDLCNGATVVQLPAESVTYWHVELDRHDAILAEGVWCESYLDTGNRGAFANGGPSVQVHPDFALKTWQAEACAPPLKGRRLVAAKRRFLARAIASGYVITDDPGLKLLAHGRELAAEIIGRHWRVRLPAGTNSVRLKSRIWTPAHTRPSEHDTRSLGVAIARLWLDRREVSFCSSGVSCGWHPAEAGWRWTDGDAELAVTGVRELAFELAMTGSYWRGGEPAAALAA